MFESIEMELDELKIAIYAPNNQFSTDVNILSNPN